MKIRDLRVSVIIIFSLLAQFCFSQRVIVNSNGERIIMFPDGSWRLAEAGDSILIRKNLQKSETLGLENESMNPAQVRTSGEYDDYILRQWNELHFNIKATEKKIQNEFRAATNAQFSAAEIYHNAEANKSMIDPVRLATITENYEKSIKQLKQAKVNQQSIKKLLDQSKKLASVAPAKMEPRLNSLKSKYNLFMSKYTGAPVEENVKEIKSKKTKEKTQKPFVKPDKRVKNPVDEKSNGKVTSNDLPPHARIKTYKSDPFDCDVRTDTVDETTGRRKIELAPALFFTHTDPDLRPYFKDKELITCYAKMSKSDAYVYLTIDFQIASSHSQSNFGSLSNGSLLRFRLLNGEFVSLYNLRADRGRIDPYSGHTIFTGLYALGKEEIKMLQQNQLDKVRILWSTGYEDYDIYKVDFMIDHLNCLLSR